MAQPGDLVEISRGQYCHWALYVGDGYVIHIIADDIEVSAEGAITSIAAGVGLTDSITAQARREKLEDVARGDRWCVNNYLDAQHKSKPIEVILKEAEELVGTEVLYSLLTHNCEHFATNLRYGMPESRQAQEAIETGSYMAAAAIRTSLAIPEPHTS